MRNLLHVNSALKHLSKVVLWQYTEEPILVRNLFHVLCALWHLNKIAICCYTEDHTQKSIVVQNLNNK